MNLERPRHVPGKAADAARDESSTDVRKHHVRALQALKGDAFPGLSPDTRAHLIEQLRAELSYLERRLSGN